jgi:formate hydrogenlyase subunit 6/NADH:ubiquinone oxidoreductase subunit I
LKKGANSTYFGNIKEGIKTSMKGLSLTWKHFKDARQSRKPIFVDNPDYFKQQTGIVTLQYPHQHLPLPDNGRYQLHNEMDDCIVCDKCAKVCPVDCIEIEPIKATGIAGYASDGSAIRLFAAKFDIDMSKCMFCGLCTTVCPTECLTMTSEYDFSTFDVKTHNFEFGNLTPEQSQEKRELYEQFMAEKEALKLVNRAGGVPQQRMENSEVAEIKSKPVFKPSFKPKVAESQEVIEKIEEMIPEIAKPKPAFKPSFKPKPIENIGFIEDKIGEEVILEVPKPKPVFKPSFKPKPIENKGFIEDKMGDEVILEGPKPKPSFKPKPLGIDEVIEDKVGEEIVIETPNPKPVFKPRVVENKEIIEDKVGEEKVEEMPKPKPVFKPSFKPKPKVEDDNNRTVEPSTIQ